MSPPNVYGLKQLSALDVALGRARPVDDDAPYLGATVPPPETAISRERREAIERRDHHAMKRIRQQTPATASEED